MGSSIDSFLRLKLSIEDIYLFELLATLGSISGVADRTGMTQPAITQRLSRLEHQVGAVLWKRRGRSLGEPTEVGRRFLHYARNVLRETAGMLSDIGVIANEKTLDIVASSIPSEYLLPRLLARYYGEFPDDEIRLTMAGSRKICSMVESGAADLGFSGYVVPGFSGRIIPVAEDRIVPVVSPDSAIAKAGVPITLESLMTLPLVMREEDSGTRSVLEEALLEHGIMINPVKTAHIVGSAHALIEAVRQGAGFSFVSSYSVAGLHVPAVTDFPEIRRVFYLLHRNETVGTGNLSNFVKFAVEYFEACRI